jgi:hypothetical protein
VAPIRPLVVMRSTARDVASFGLSFVYIYATTESALMDVGARCCVKYFPRLSCLCGVRAQQGRNRSSRWKRKAERRAECEKENREKKEDKPEVQISST